MENLKRWGKNLLKYGLIGLVVIIGIKMIIGKTSKGGEEKPVTAATGKSFAEGLDLSQRREKMISVETIIPDRKDGKLVPISIPCYKVANGTMWYQVAVSPTVKVEYDFLDGKPARKDGPGEVLAVERFPPVFHVQAIGSGGKLTMTLTRQFLPDSSGDVKKETKKVSSKRVRMSRKDLTNADVPHSVQIM